MIKLLSFCLLYILKIFKTFRESLNYVASAFKIASMPSQVTRGEGASAAYTGLYFCG